MAMAIRALWYIFAIWYVGSDCISPICQDLLFIFLMVVGCLPDGYCLQPVTLIPYSIRGCQEMTDSCFIYGVVSFWDVMSYWSCDFMCFTVLISNSQP